jgi:hypothetical protein
MDIKSTLVGAGAVVLLAGGIFGASAWANDDVQPAPVVVEPTVKVEKEAAPVVVVPEPVVTPEPEPVVVVPEPAVEQPAPVVTAGPAPGVLVQTEVGAPNPNGPKIVEPGFVAGPDDAPGQAYAPPPPTGD